MNIKKNYGFTLAEVLITLAIIGVVAALTIPSLITKTQDSSYRSAMKKNVSYISDAALQLATANEGNLSGALGTVQFDNDAFRDKFIPYFKVVKTCNSGSAANTCWADDTWRYLNGAPGNDWTGDSRLVLADGAFLGFYLLDPDCNDNASTANDICGQIVFDVNGFKNPNVLGKDIFNIYVGRTGRIMLAGAADDFDDNTIDPGCDPEYNLGFSCTAYYFTH